MSNDTLELFNKIFPDSKYREIGAYYDGDDHDAYQKNKAPINTKILTFDEVKDTTNRIGWIIPNDYIAVDLDDKLEAAKLYNIIKAFEVKCIWMIGKHGGHFIFKNTGNFTQGTKFATSIGLSIDTRCQEKGYIILPHNDPDRKFGELSFEIDDLPFYLRPLKKFRNPVDLIDMEEGGRNDALVKHLLSLKDYAPELSLDEKIQSIKIINNFIFKEPIDERELFSTVLREDMINKVADGENDESRAPMNKRAMRLEEIASSFIEAHKTITINDIIHIYNGKYYQAFKSQEIERLLHEEYDKTLLAPDRKEILNFIKLKTYVEPNRCNNKWNEVVVKNGILNLSNMKLYNHTPESYNTIYLNVNWNPEVNYSKLIDDYFNYISYNDPDKKKFFYEVIGYCMLRKNCFSKMFILYGGGGTGKSTFLNLIKKLIGEQYCSYLTLNDMEKDFMTAELFGKLVNLGDDIDARGLKETGMLKSIVTGETVQVRRIYSEPINFNNFATLIFTCNKLPSIQDRSSGMLRRLCLVELNRKIENSNPFFIESLTEEDMDYLFYNCIKYLYKALKEGHLSENDGMLKALADFKTDQSSVLSFIKDMNIGDSEINLAPLQTLFDLYNEYCIRVKIKTPMNRINFRNEICEQLGYKIVNTTSNGEKQCLRFKKATT